MFTLSAFIRVVAAGELRHTDRGATHPAGGLGGERAARDQVEGALAGLLVRLAAGAVALVNFCGREVRLEFDTSAHDRFLPVLNLSGKSV